MGQAGLRGDAVRHGRDRPADRRCTWQPSVRENPDCPGARGAQPGTGAAHAVRRVRSGRPARVAGPADRVQPQVSQVALGRVPGPGRPAPAHRGARDPRPDGGAADPPGRGTDHRDRGRPADVHGREPGPAGRLRAAGAARPAAERGGHRAGRTRTAPRTGRWPGSRSAVKDIIAVAGVTARCGSPVYDPAPAAQDAELVRRLRAAGRGSVRDHPVPGVRGRVRAPGGGRHPQPARSVPDLGRVVRRFGGAGRGGRVRPGDRHRHRRVDPDPGGLLRHHRAQADVRAGPGGRGVPALAVLRPRGHADRVAGWVGPAAPGTGRSRPGRRARGVAAARPGAGRAGADRAAVRPVGDAGGCATR